jgi:predicted RNase H-like nuclease (RuvC/YqgF family)
MNTLEHRIKELKRRIELKRQLMSLTEQRIQEMEDELAEQEQTARRSYWERSTPEQRDWYVFAILESLQGETRTTTFDGTENGTVRVDTVSV